jgi:hypothetical protein
MTLRLPRTIPTSMPRRNTCGEPNHAADHPFVDTQTDNVGGAKPPRTSAHATPRLLPSGVLTLAADHTRFDAHRRCVGGESDPRNSHQWSDTQKALAVSGPATENNQGSRDTQTSSVVLGLLSHPTPNHSRCDTQTALVGGGV